MPEENPFLKHIDKILNYVVEIHKDEFIEDFDFFLQIYRKLKDSELNFEEVDLDDLEKSVRDCEHKLRAMRHQTNNLEVMEDAYIKKTKEMMDLVPIENFTSATMTPEVTYEFEAFLFQAKACLDMFAKSVGMIYKQTPSKIGRLRNILKRLEGKPLASEILTIIDKNSWIVDFESEEGRRSLRDIVTHYGTLKHSSLNIVKRNGKDYIDLRVSIKEIPLVKYCEEKNQQFLDLIREVYFLIFSL